MGSKELFCERVFYIAGNIYFEFLNSEFSQFRNWPMAPRASTPRAQKKPAVAAAVSSSCSAGSGNVGGPDSKVPMICSDEYESKRRKKSSKGSLRGLLINPAHIGKFFLPVMERKTHEVRNFNCQVVSKGSVVFLLESGACDAKGRAVFKVRAKAEFKGNTFVKHSDFPKHFHHHRCSLDEYNQVRKGWTTDKEGCVLWELLVIEILDQPLYLVPKQGEVWCIKTATVLLFGRLFFFQYLHLIFKVLSRSKDKKPMIGIKI